MVVARNVFVLLSVLVVSWGVERCEGVGKFDFEVHHVFSDTVKETLGFGDLVPETGSMEYFKVLAHRDRFIRGRGLASNNEETPVTFMRGNRTLALQPLGFLHYANVSVGTPPTWFFVALDTGSDLFWLPCNCGTGCIRNMKDVGIPQSIPLNLYSPNASSTSSSIRCSDNRCFDSRPCSSPSSICPYQVQYSSNTTTSRGTLLQDVLHLITEDEDLEPVKANITLGCGRNQTGSLRGGMAVNGLLGLGLEDYSVPSVLAKANITANSFSMCFGNVVNIVGRISFGDKGYTDQMETPLVKLSPTYAVNVMEVSVGKDDLLGVELLAEFDSGSAFTHLVEPAYDIITKAFDDKVSEQRRPTDPEIPFEFCYDLSPNTSSFTYSKIVITLGGGSPMVLRDPLFSVLNEDETFKYYCLGILKSLDSKLNTIGQNWMSGYRIVFDRERMILGWKPSDCFEDESLASQPPPPPEETEAPPPAEAALPPPPPPASAAIPPPVDTTGNPGEGGAASLSPLASLLLLLLPLLAFL